MAPNIDDLNTLLRLQAEKCVAAGLSTLPAIRRGEEKRVALLKWKPYQERLPDAGELESWFGAGVQAICIVCGKVSGNLEMIDFDLGGAMYAAWRESVEAMAPGLLERLIIESTPSGGLHAVYRCESEVCGNVKLANRVFDAMDEKPITVGGKDYRPRQCKDGSWAATAVAIETRGEGGLFLCAPSPGYKILQGDLSRPPTITTDERDILLGCAWQLDESRDGREIVGASPVGPSVGGHRPGDEFSKRGDPRPFLEAHGWVMVRGGENEHWRRPGKDTGSSATLKDGVFYVFSSNAAPFEPSKGYSPFAVYTLLEHQGDFAHAASALASNGYGSQELTPTVDLTAFSMSSPETEFEKDSFIPRIISAGELVEKYPTLRSPVIHGLLRVGESMNIIAAPKSHKSWLALDLAIAVATGRPWLGRFQTEQGNVLIIDNELHPETSAHRVPMVLKARAILSDQIGDRLYVDNMRGQLRDVFSLNNYFQPVERNQYKVVILDAFYRFMPVDKDENDNGTMSNIYNCIDGIANRVNCCFVMIHHTSKGNQSGKSVSDVGAGAGAQSRAADVHAVLRPHEEEGAVVLDAMIRSWPPLDPIVLRWQYPVWNIDESLDATTLKSLRPPRSRNRDSKPAKLPEPEWDVDRFVSTFFSETPITWAELRENTREVDGLSHRRVKDLTELAESKKKIFRNTVGRSHRVLFSTTRPSSERDGSDA
jgi:AAA domain-containing protein/bifunctional DNA primase/polymerase-like protein